MGMIFMMPRNGVVDCPMRGAETQRHRRIIVDSCKVVVHDKLPPLTLFRCFLFNYLLIQLCFNLRMVVGRTELIVI